MIKKILCMLFCLFAVDMVHAAQIVNVEYIHNLIESKWSVRIPYSAELDNPAVAANMQYLLTSVDIANQMVNGGRISDYGTGEFISYGTGEFATLAAADTIVANTAIENYVQSIDWRFSATATDTTVSFDISAAGTFYVNWGDGIIERIVRPVAVNETYSHTYASAGNHTIRFGGRANGYLSSATTPAISFKSQRWLGGIDGCLGCIFSTLTDGTQPRFQYAFMSTGITSIPETLFGGLTGPVAQYMFRQTFSSTKVTDIPQNLFGDLTGTAQYAFFATFSMSRVQNIPVGLFDKFQGIFRSGMFRGTFENTDIIQIPDRLFAGFTQSIARTEVFYRTFQGCDKLQSIPANLFGTTVPTRLSGIVYVQMFSGCTALTGPSARINGRYLYEIFPDEDEATVGGMYYRATGLTDYEDIPMPWGGPVRYSFSFTNENPDSPVQFTISEPGYYYVQYDDGYTPQYQAVSEGSPVTFKCLKAWGYACDTIRIAGRATGYTGQRSAIAFQCGTDANISQITGSLGEIFSSKPTATYPQPRFGATFLDCNITSIPENLFSGISGAPTANMFMSTFARTQITEIPENLFAGIQGAPANVVFANTFSDTPITEIPAGLFAGIQGTPAESMFAGTFLNTPITEIPSGLFAGIQGRPAIAMFESTFANCKQLQTIPSGLFAGIDMHLYTATMMFQSTFEQTGITSIPTDLFAPSAPTNILLQDGAFAYMFAGCENLTGESLKIGGKYLYEIWPDATDEQAQGTYYGSVKLTDWPTIPTVWGGLGTGVTFWATTTDSTTSFSFVTYPQGTFYIDWGDGEIEGGRNTGTKQYSHTYKTPGEYTIRMGANPTKYSRLAPLSISFANNQNLAKIEGSLGKMFPKLSDGTQPIFWETFGGCANLEGPIPADLFSGIDSAPVDGMFQYTFRDCSGLTGEIPDGLFAGIRGAPAAYMFDNTFSGCSGLTGEIPENLFAGISGAPAEYMFQGTFSGCSGLTGDSAKINGQYLYDIWDTGGDSCYTDATGLDDYRYIPTAWGGLGQEKIDYVFSFQTQHYTRVYELNIGAAGKFYVDWGDGTEQVIEKATVGEQIYSHTYSNLAPNYTIQMGGKATAYPTNSAAIVFRAYDQNDEGTDSGISAMDGCLGCIFSTLADGTNPRFDYTFYGTNITSVPETLFNGISGQGVPYMFKGTFMYTFFLSSLPDNLFPHVTPSEYMFAETFSYATDLTSIPENLFAGIRGAPAEGLFFDTFNNCTALTSIPENLFAGIQGPPAEEMFSFTFAFSEITSIPENLFAGISGAPAPRMFWGTFMDCSGLTGEIPDGLFAGIQGPPAERMFDNTFKGCSGLTGEIPENLFAGIDVTAPAATEMFDSTFSGCSGLTGDSAKINGQYLYDIWDTGGDYCYDGATGLDDYRYIPTAWGGLGQKKQFCYTITDGSENRFELSAAGTFTIDWGGVTETVTKTYVRNEQFSCPSGAECKTVCISGTATDYSTTEAVLSFYHGCSDGEMELEAISGSLGDVFPTLANGRQPLFIQTFMGCRIYGGLPDGLFDGIHGAPAANMFYSTFALCGGGLTSIPEDLFSGISGPLASGTFYDTFGYTWSLTGPSARINGQYLYEIWPDATTGEVGGMYSNATELSDYSSIPDVWK